MLNMAVFAPMPRASARTATSVKPGFLMQHADAEAHVLRQHVEPGAGAVAAHRFFHLLDSACFDSCFAAGLLGVHSVGHFFLRQSIPRGRGFLHLGRGFVLCRWLDCGRRCGFGSAIAFGFHPAFRAIEIRGRVGSTLPYKIKTFASACFQGSGDCQRDAAPALGFGFQLFAAGFRQHVIFCPATGFGFAPRRG